MPLDLSQGTVEVYHEARGQGGTPPLVTTVRVEIHGKHARLGVWNRGGKSGELVVNAADAREFIDALIPRRYQREERIA